MKTWRSTVICTTVGLALSGCALATVGPAEPPQTYDLLFASQSSHIHAKRTRGLQVVVNEPVALRSLAGDRIAVRPTASEIRYFGKATWSDQLPRLVQARMIEALGNSGRFGAVASSRERLDADVAVATEIRAFQVELQHTFPVARVDLFVRLIDQRRARVITERSFRDETEARTDNATAGVEALNASMQALLPRVAAWAGKVRMKAAATPPRTPPARPRRRPDPELPLRDTQTDERETDPDARPPVSQDLLIGRRRSNGRL